MTNELDSIVQVVKDHLAFPKRLRISSNAKYELAVDLVFVAFGVRYVCGTSSCVSPHIGSTEQDIWWTAFLHSKRPLTFSAESSTG